MIGVQAASLLWDARRALGQVLAYTAGKTFEEHERDDLLRDGVERPFIIVGEVFAQLRRVDSATASRIPDFAAIGAFRNVLVHGYTVISNDVVWAAAGCSGEIGACSGRPSR